MIRLSVRWKLTLMYAGTVALLLLIFIGADVVGLKRNLSAQALSQEMVTATWMRALWEHMLLAMGLIGVVFAFGYFFISRLLKPIREITRTARTITADDLSRRVSVRDQHDELGELAEVINGMISGLEGAFARMKGFSADVAHELSTPLTVLRGELELAMRKERSPESYRQTLRHALREVDHLSAIVSDLLFLAQADARNLPVATHTIAMDDVLIASYEDILPVAQAAGVGVELDEIDDVEVMGNRQLLKHMVSNLLGNAVKFTPREGTVRISLKRRGDDFALTIGDTGIGIPPEDIGHVFERFYRVDKSRSRRTDGVGLGLAIAREIAAVHNLHITLESRTGQGTVVSVMSAPRQNTMAHMQV